MSEEKTVKCKVKLVRTWYIDLEVPEGTDEEEIIYTTSCDYFDEDDCAEQDWKITYDEEEYE